MVLALLMNHDAPCPFFQPFNHGHKVAKFCYADKVSPWWPWLPCRFGVHPPTSLPLSWESLG